MTQSGQSARDRNHASDIVPDSWVLRWAPARLRPYLQIARLDRPIGTWLLLFPCWWSYALALEANGGLMATPWPGWLPFGFFAIGALAMRGAGCTVNDLADREIDAKVARTASRPLPSGRITTFQALVFLALQLAVGLTVLIQFNSFAIAVGIAALALVIPYPFMKRITYWPQAWLGLTFNWGALVGWAAVTGSIGAPALLLYAGGIAWTLGYDTIYAHQDKADDVLIGVKSSALKLGTTTKPWLAAFYGLALTLFLAAGLAAGLAWPFWLAAPLLALHLGWQIVTVTLDDPQDCAAKFKSNRHIGWIFLLAIFASGLAA